MKVTIGLDDKTRRQITGILNRLLADEVVLYVKTRNFHWNVEGPDFGILHKFFEEQYENLDEVMDEVAERARALDGYAAGSLAEFLKLATLKEARGESRLSSEMLAELLADHEAVIRQLRKDIGSTGATDDAGTEDFLTGVMAEHEKMAWMLRAHLKGRATG